MHVYRHPDCAPQLGCRIAAALINPAYGSVDTWVGRPPTRNILLAILIEIVALAVYFPAFIEGMMRHSALAPRKPIESVSNALGFVMHLPTILLTYPLDGLVLVTPLTQIVFWSWLLGYLRRRNASLRSTLLHDEW